MARTIEISVAAEQTHELVEKLQHESGVLGINLHRGAALIPPGNVLTIITTNEGLAAVQRILAEHDFSGCASVVTSEPRSLVSPSHQTRIDEETNESSWPEMASLFRRETNVTSNYLMAMAFAGMVAAAGLWADTVHIVVGAMVMAPGFEPILRVPFGLLARDRRSWSVGLRSTLIGYASMMAGAAGAYLVLSIVQPSQTELSGLPLVQYWTGLTPSSVLVAMAASAAGAAIIAAQRSVLTAGVMIALALVPSASIVGMASAAGDIPLAGMALLRWAIDAGCVVVAGGLVFLLKRRHLRQKDAPARAGASQR